MKDFYKWDCPICDDTNEDSDDIFETTCSNGHNVTLVWDDKGIYKAELLKL